MPMVLKLIEDILPTLSEGWGNGLGCFSSTALRNGVFCLFLDVWTVVKPPSLLW